MTRELAILALDGIADSSLSVLLDVVRAAATIARRANRRAPLQATIVSPSGHRMRTGTGVMRTDVRSMRALTSKPPIVVVPGIWIDDPAVLPRLLARADVARAAAALQRAHDDGALIAGTCSGAFVVARSGLLDRKRATTTWWLAAEMRAMHPAIDVRLDEALVIHGRVITAGAVFAVADLALYLVARFGGPALARETARVLLLDRHASQARYMAKHHLRTHDSTVRRAESWARAHLADRFDIGALARASGTSSRTLARRLDAALGLSPIGFVQQLRLEHAINLIETSPLSMDEIASRVGYEDANTLRRLVRRETRTTPRQLRSGR